MVVYGSVEGVSQVGGDPLVKYCFSEGVKKVVEFGAVEVEDCYCTARSMVG